MVIGMRLAAQQHRIREKNKPNYYGKLAGQRFICIKQLSMKKYYAELFGTFLLTLAVIVSTAKLAIPTPVVAGLTLGVMVYALGTISGAHFNPAITIGAWSVKKISLGDAGYYILFQLIGAVLAWYLSRYLVVLPTVSAVNSLRVGISELVGTFTFAFGVASVVFNRVSEQNAGFVIGASLLLGALIASTGSSGFLNPAVAFGANSINLMYAAGPIAGSLLGFWVYRFLDARG